MLTCGFEIKYEKVETVGSLQKLKMWKEEIENITVKCTTHFMQNDTAYRPRQSVKQTVQLCT